MNLKVNCICLSVAIAPAAALAPVQCYNWVWECTTNDCANNSASNCQLPPVQSSDGTIKINEWEYRDQICHSYTSTALGQCDPTQVGSGWDYIFGCGPDSNGYCCHGEQSSRTTTEGPTQIQLPKAWTACIQPGGQG